MIRDRFAQILSNTQFNNNISQNDKEKFFKLCLIINSTNQIFSKAYFRTPKLDVSESMNKFKGCKRNTTQQNP